MNRPDISVVIPTFNRLDILRVTLEELFAEGSLCTTEIIVVSDGSTDGTLEHLNELNSAGKNITTIDQKNQGAGAARNNGAAASSAEIVLFIDDDMRADPLLLDAHLRCYKNTDCLDAVVGCMNFDTRSPKTILSNYVDTWSLEFKEQLIEQGITSGADILSGHFSIRKNVFTELGGFHETFTRDGRYGNEDIDFGTRLYNSSRNLTYCKSAITRQYYKVAANTKFKQAIDLAVVDKIFAKREKAGIRLLEQRTTEIASIDNLIIDKLSARFPYEIYLLFYPIRKLTCILIDLGKRHALVHYLFGLNQALAYRYGISK